MCCSLFSVLCVVLGLGSIVVSTPCLRERVLKKCLKRGNRKNKKVRIHTKKVNVVVEDGVEMTTQRKETKFET